VMERLVNGRVIQSLGWLATTVILTLNGVLLWQSLGSH
jgi:Mn2+/Fe2+ NRAMP family transporter